MTVYRHIVLHMLLHMSRTWLSADLEAKARLTSEPTRAAKDAQSVEVAPWLTKAISTAAYYAAIRCTR